MSLTARRISKVLKHITPRILILALVAIWIFSGFPQIWQNPRIPSKIQEAQAASPIPTYVGSGTFTIGTGAITPPFPSGTQAGDVCLLVAESENQAISLSSAQGFAELPSSPQYAGPAGTSPANRIAVFWKRLVGGDTAPTVADSGDHTSGQIHCFRGVTGVGNPWDVTVGGNDGGANDTSGVIPGSTTTVANTLVVLIQGTSYDGNSTAQCSGWTNASLANLTEWTDNTKNTGLGGGHCMATGEKATAGAYSDTTVTLANTTYKGAISVALKPPAPTFTQSAYRFFNNLDSTDVGTPLAAQDTPATLGSTGATFRLRMLLHIGTDYLPASGESFKLQFAQRGSDNQCDTSFNGESYADVTTSTVIAYNNNPTPADGAALTANTNDPMHGTDTIVNQTYEELNNFTNSVAAIPSGQDGKWDFSLKDNGASANTAYCFRVVKSDGSLLDTYTVIPQITTAAATVVSVSVSDGSVAYGIMPANTSKSTLPGELNDMQTATNDGNVTENFNIKGQNAIGGGCTWTLASTNGTDQYVHQFCNDTDYDCSSPPTNYTALTTSYQALDTGIPVGGTVQIQLRLTTPTSSSCFGQQSVDVTIQAVQP
jgi:hypothetical protein